MNKILKLTEQILKEKKQVNKGSAHDVYHQLYELGYRKTSRVNFKELARSKKRM